MFTEHQSEYPVPLTEGEIVALFDYFTQGRVFYEEVCGTDLATALEKIGQTRNAIYAIDEVE